MKISMASKSLTKAIMYSTFALIVVLFLFANLINIWIPGDPPIPTINNSLQFPKYGAEIRVGINRILKNERLTASDLISLDFSDYDDAKGSVRKIFHESGGNVKPFDYNKQKIESRFVFSLANKVSGASTEKSDLLMLLKNPGKQVCEDLQKQNGVGLNKIPKLLKSPNLTPHPQEVNVEEVVVEFPSEPFGCVNAPDGFYFYYLLFSR